MEINLGEEKIVVLQSALSDEVIRDRVMNRRVDAFGTLTKLLDRPRADDIELVRSEKRLEPFWFASAKAVYRYDRRHTYTVEVAPEVTSVSFDEHDHPVVAGRARHFTVEAVNHCLEEFDRQMTLEPQRGEERNYSRYLAFKGSPVESLTDLRGEDVALVPPQVRASFVVRKLAQLLMKSIDADAILEERIDVPQVVLYLRPVHAFELHWKSRDKRSVVEYDALTEEVRSEGGQLKERVTQVLNDDSLFDIGADIAGTVLPGAGIAIKLGRLVARKAIEPA